MKRNYFNMHDSGVLYLLYLIVSLLLSSIVSMICANTGLNSSNEYYSILLLALNQIAILIAFFGYTKIAKINFIEASNLRNKPTVKQSFVASAIAISSMIAFLPIAYLFLYLLTLGGFKVVEPIKIPTSAGGIICGLIFAVIMPAVLEELIYRGAVLNGLKQKNYLFAIIMTSVIFSLSHGNAVQTVHQFLASIVICMIVLYGDSIWYGIIAHFTNNLVSFIFYFIPLDLAGLGYYNILLGISMFIVGMILLSILMKLFKQQAKDKINGVEGVIDVYPNGRFRYILSSIYDTFTKFFRCIVSREDRKKCREHFEEEVGFLDKEYREEESVMGSSTSVSLIVIGVVVVLAIMWIVSLIQGF